MVPEKGTADQSEIAAQSMNGNNFAGVLENYR
jgi:hypothetical protein